MLLAIMKIVREWMIYINYSRGIGNLPNNKRKVSYNHLRKGFHKYNSQSLVEILLEEDVASNSRSYQLTYIK